MMDYKQLLKKYIQHVGSCEGIWFEDRDESYTDEEWAAIQEVFAELDAEQKSLHPEHRR